MIAEFDAQEARIAAKAASDAPGFKEYLAEAPKRKAALMSFLEKGRKQ